MSFFYHIGTVSLTHLSSCLRKTDDRWNVSHPPRRRKALSWLIFPPFFLVFWVTTQSGSISSPMSSIDDRPIRLNPFSHSRIRAIDRYACRAREYAVQLMAVPHGADLAWPDSPSLIITCFLPNPVFRANKNIFFCRILFLVSKKTVAMFDGLITDFWTKKNMFSISILWIIKCMVGNGHNYESLPLSHSVSLFLFFMVLTPSLRHWFRRANPQTRLSCVIPEPVNTVRAMGHHRCSVAPSTRCPWR